MSAFPASIYLIPDSFQPPMQQTLQLIDMARTHASDLSMALAEEGQPPRKKLRKGTHSCLECKRRKVRCTFPSNNQSVCVECAVRKCACISQEYEAVPIQRQVRREKVRDRIGRLEAMVEQLQSMAELQNPNIDENQRSAAQALENMSVALLTPATTPPESAIELTGSLEHAPLISLFDNAILSRKEDDSYRSSSPRDESRMRRTSGSGLDADVGDGSGNNGNLCKTLLSCLPPRSALASILDAGSSWWAFWQELCPVISEDNQPMSLPQFVADALRKRHPVPLAEALLCIAISVQELPVDYDYDSLSLPVPVENILQHYVSTVQRLVTWDDELVGNLNGLEFLLLQSKCHVNLGQPRKAWLLVRRAASLAQHLGLHRSSTRCRGGPGSTSMRRRMRVWWTIYEYDRYMSLLLGLPCAILDQHIDFCGEDEEICDMEARYWRRLTVICGDIIDLTQASVPPTFAATCAIDQKLEELTKSVSSDWWETGSGENAGLNIFLKRLLAQCSHHYMRAMLHIPFMLRAVTDQRYEQSRLICTSSARTIIKQYHILRNDVNARSYVCPIVDFQSFTAATMLLLNLLGHNKSSPSHDPRQAESDWAMVDSMIDLMRLGSKRPCSVVATQAVKVLETLRVGSDVCDGKSVTLVIPYFGAITIGPGSQLRPTERDESLTREQKSTSETGLDVDALQNTTQMLPNSPSVYVSDEPLISFSSLMGSASSPSQMPWPSQDYIDELLRDPISLDFDHEWNRIWKDGVIG